MPSVLSDAAQWLRRRSWHMALVLAVAALAGLFGFGLHASVLSLLGGQAGLAGAVVGAVVAAVAVPLALWARPPQLPRAVLRPALPPAASATVTPLRPADVVPTALPVKGAVPAALVGAQGAVAAARTTSAAALGTFEHFSSTAAAASDGGASGPAMGATSAQAAADAASAVRDALTGAYTQQHFVAAADREWSRIRRHGEDAALLMIDIDRLTGVNDRYGAACGDSLLVEITRQVSGTLRQYDLLARFGGGVLVVYLPQTDPIGALDVAERIRERVAVLRVNWDNHSVRSTVSVGVAGIGASHGALDEVIADAGAALREAKAAGRNCVRAAPIPPRRNANPGFPQGAKRPAGPL